ncbi:alpha-L-fucosidase [Enterococcus sp. BWR-S5]|uniref:alpha-L-fucosidase n=1 Tax=Enterococcus sp. BWR-S5 TaxID=2787714 RepID=UPI00192350C2|nr:alpha-L-fucosidase [Enterococcus sp. BWR-S5]MBL1227467.1 alpha-L-fucosidase [Enterococcus sp. BWR-S5]
MKIRQDIEENSQTQQEAYGELPLEVKRQLEQFQDDKLGVIFHWGLYAVAGIVESWQLSEEDDWARKKPWRNDLNQLRRDYWQLEESFNPQKFCPEDWAVLCKQAGFNYMIFTTKHHDGFNMYDTQASEYKVSGEHCPFHTNQHKDIFKTVVDAFRKEGLSIGAYYSKADWSSPLYWEPESRPVGRYASYDPLEKPRKWQKYQQFVFSQLKEICSSYGDIDILWLDAGWVNSANNEYLAMDEIIPQLREKQPQLIVVDRTIGGAYENYVTPERKVPDTLPEKVWESNIPLAKNWGYVPNDEYKSFEEILSLLIKIVSKGGNLLLGVGPKLDGTLPKEAVSLLAQLGDWLQIYGQGIYGTRKNSVSQIDHWYFTKKGQTIYAFHFNKETEAVPELCLDELAVDASVVTVSGLKSNDRYLIQNGKIQLTEKDQREFVTGIEIQIGTEG